MSAIFEIKLMRVEMISPGQSYPSLQKSAFFCVSGWSRLKQREEQAEHVTIEPVTAPKTFPHPF